MLSYLILFQMFFQWNKIAKKGLFSDLRLKCGHTTKWKVFSSWRFNKCATDWRVTICKTGTAVMTTFQQDIDYCIESPLWSVMELPIHSVFVHVWGPYTVFQLIIAPSLPCVPSVCSLCGQITSTCHSLSSPILPSLFSSLHTWVSLFIQSDGLGPTCLILSMWVRMHTHKSTYHRLCVCHPFTWLNACILWFQIDWTDGQMTHLSLSLSHIQ